jgi:hypothetical protein
MYETNPDATITEQSTESTNSDPNLSITTFSSWANESMTPNMMLTMSTPTDDITEDDTSSTDSSTNITLSGTIGDDLDTNYTTTNGFDISGETSGDTEVSTLSTTLNGAIRTIPTVTTDNQIELNASSSTTLLDVSATARSTGTGDIPDSTASDYITTITDTRRMQTATGITLSDFADTSVTASDVPDTSVTKSGVPLNYVTKSDETEK